MTGGEIVAGAIVKKVAAAALSEDPSEKQLLRELAKADPAMAKAAEAHAKRIAVKQAFLLKLFQPLGSLVGISKAYFQTDFAVDLASRLDGVPDDQLVSPSPSVAVPTMQALGYSLDEPDLKEMYLNLLATATDARAKDDAHPAFAEIIRQLTPGEADLLPKILTGRFWPMVRVDAQERASAATGGYEEILRHLLALSTDESGSTPEEVPLLPVWVDNWARLGLVDAAYDKWVNHDNAYDWVEARPEVLRLRATYDTDKRMVRIQRGILQRTDFGESFRRAISR
jgi:hypothetical protein